jgi:hypothetical protein
MNTLNGIELPEDLHWADEFDWQGVGQSRKYGLSGAQIVSEDAVLAGRPMTLSGEAASGFSHRDWADQPWRVTLRFLEV